VASTILTAEGRYFYFAQPEAHDYTVTEIAHALSQLCRYTGHSLEFYSVAEHSVRVALAVPPEYALEALLHDASEAYLGDVSSPLKRLLPDYKAIEERVERAITAHFGLPFPLSPIVKRADIQLLLTEKRDLLHPSRGAIHDIHWGQWPDIQPLEKRIHPLSPAGARAAFLDLFARLTQWP
jgi:hypothetical protein